MRRALTAALALVCLAATVSGAGVGLALELEASAHSHDGSRRLAVDAIHSSLPAHFEESAFSHELHCPACAAQLRTIALPAASTGAPARRPATAGGIGEHNDWLSGRDRLPSQSRAPPRTL